MTLSAEHIATLTPKEREVLSLAVGRTNKEIAQLCACSPNTVKTHLASARRKLGVGSKGQAARAFAEGSDSSHPFRANPLEVIEKADPIEHQPDGPSAVHEERTPFRFDERALEPNVSVNRKDHDDVSAPLVRLWLVARLVLALAITTLLARSLAKGFQAFSDALYPYTH